MMAMSAIGKAITWEEIDTITGYNPSRYTWTISVIEPLCKIIPNIKFISEMDYKKFSEEGKTYLEKIWDKEWFELQAKNSSPDFKSEQRSAESAVKAGLFCNQPLSTADIESLLENFFLITLVDGGKLFDGNFSSGHFVFVYSHNKDSFELHDPGLPPNIKYRIDKKKFINAFGGDVIAIPRVTGLS